MHFNSSLGRAAICLALLLSPVGAPLIGALIMSCAPDGVEPTGPFAMGFSYCGVSRPIEHLYQQAFILSLLPMAIVGPLVGGVLTLAWWTGAIGTAAGCAVYLRGAMASAPID